MAERASKIHNCTRPGCNNRATCIPVLTVPQHALAKIEHQVRSVLWLPLCDRHFNAVTLAEFLSGEAYKGVEESVTADFRSYGSFPDFKKATVTKETVQSSAFAEFEQIQKQKREEMN